MYMKLAYWFYQKCTFRTQSEVDTVSINYFYIIHASRVPVYIILFSYPICDMLDYIHIATY